MVNVDVKKCKNCEQKISSGNFCKKPSYCRYEYMHKIRNPKTVKILNEKDDTFFYLLGLIATDGHLHKHCYGIEITLNKKDKKVLQLIKKKYGGSIKLKKDNTVVWYISYKPFYDFCCEIGITPAKSKSINVNNFFYNLKLTEQISFLRGVLDGDGGVRTYNNYLSFEICSGSQMFLNMIKDFINNTLKENIVTLKWENKAKAFYIKSYAKFKPIKILNLIYSNASDKLKLDRKYNVYLNYTEKLKNEIRN